MIGSGRTTTGCTKSAGRSKGLVVFKGYAASTLDSKTTDHVNRGSTPAPAVGRMVSQRQDELDIRGGESRSTALPSCRPTHPFHAPNARQVARRAASKIGIEDFRLAHPASASGPATSPSPGPPPQGQRLHDRSLRPANKMVRPTHEPYVANTIHIQQYTNITASATDMIRIAIRPPTFILAATLALGVMPATALATSQDVQSTQTYIHADHTLQLADTASLPLSQTAASELVGDVHTRCPNVMAGAPRNTETADVGAEILGSVLVALTGPEDRATIKFARRVEKLRWTSRKLEHTVRSYAIELKAQATLARPNLCADLKAWVASGYTTLPASTVRFGRQVNAIIAGPGPGEVPLRLFAAYERPDEKTVIRQTKLLDAALTKSQIAILETTLSQISLALGQST
jgi:hypothetical protein